MTLVHFDETMMHLMQFSLVISHCNITFLVLLLSQGSVATLIRWGGWSSYCHVPFISISISENCIKIRWFLTKLQTKNKLAPFLWPNGVYHVLFVSILLHVIFYSHVLVYLFQKSSYLWIAVGDRVF